MKTRVFLLTLVLVAFGLRIYRLDYQSLWTDEGFSVSFATLSAERMLAMWQRWQPDQTAVVVSAVPENMIAEATDTHAPLYYFLLHYLMRTAGRTELAVRFFSVFFGLLVVPLLFVMGRRLFDRRVGCYAAAFGALSPFYVAYSQEARMYTMALAFSAASIYFTIRIAARDRSRLPLLGYVLMASLALYTHYFSALVVVFANVFVLGSLAVAKRRHRARDSESGSSSKGLLLPWLIAQASVLALLLPWATIILKQTRFPRNEALPVPSAVDVLEWSWQAMNLATGAIPRNPSAYSALTAGVVGALVLARLLADRQSRRSVILLLLYLSIPLGLAIAILQFQPMFHPRYIIALSPAYYLLLASGIDGLRKAWVAMPAPALAVVVAVFAGSLNAYYFDPAFAKDDTRSVAQYLEGSASADDLIVLDYPEPTSHYYRGEAPYVFLSGEQTTAFPALNQLGIGRKHIFLVNWWQSRADSAGVIRFILSRDGLQVESRQFRGYRVDKYRMRQGLTEFAAQTGMRELAANFDGVLKLEAAAFGVAPSEDEQERPAGTLRQGGKLWAALRWRLLRGTTGEYKAFVNLRGRGGHVVGQLDLSLRKGQLPTSRWKAGDTSETYHLVRLLPGAPPGDYTLEAGVYEAAAKRRLRVLDRSLIPSGTTAEIGKIKVVKYAEGQTKGAIGTAAESLGIATALGHDFGPLRLAGYDLPGRTLSTRDRLPLTLLWQANEDIQGEYAFRLEATSQTGRAFDWTARPLATNGWIKGQLLRDWAEFPIPGQLPPGTYRLRGHLVELAAGSRVGSVDFGTVEITARTGRRGVPPNLRPADVLFAEEIALLGFEIRQDRAKPGTAWEVTLYWQALRELDRSFTVFAHLLNAANRVAAQHDGLPAGGERPTTSWAVGEVVADRHVLEIGPEVTPGGHTLEVGLYEAASGRRLSAASQTIELMDDAALIAKVPVVH